MFNPRSSIRWVSRSTYPPADTRFAASVLERGRAHRTGSPSPHASIRATPEGWRESNVKLLQNAFDLALRDAKVAARGDGGPQPVLSIKSRGWEAAATSSALHLSAGKTSPPHRLVSPPSIPRRASGVSGSPCEGGVKPPRPHRAAQVAHEETAVCGAPSVAATLASGSRFTHAVGSAPAAHARLTEGPAGVPSWFPPTSGPVSSSRLGRSPANRW